jgi:hypothetical protein
MPNVLPVSKKTGLSLKKVSGWDEGNTVGGADENALAYACDTPTSVAHPTAINRLTTESLNGIIMIHGFTSLLRLTAIVFSCSSTIGERKKHGSLSHRKL